MNTTTRRTPRTFVATVASVALVGAGLLSAAPAVATQQTGNGGSSYGRPARDVDDVVAVRRMAMSREQVERASEGPLLDSPAFHALDDWSRRLVAIQGWS